MNKMRANNLVFMEINLNCCESEFRLNFTFKVEENIVSIWYFNIKIRKRFINL